VLKALVAGAGGPGRRGKAALTVTANGEGAAKGQADRARTRRYALSGSAGPPPASCSKTPPGFAPRAKAVAGKRARMFGGITHGRQDCDPPDGQQGLLFPNETDAPLGPFLWENAGDKLTKDKVRQLAGPPKGAAVEETTLDDLLSTVPEEDRSQFDKLAAAIKQQLSGVKVQRVRDRLELNCRERMVEDFLVRHLAQQR
jgi:hypothetical protein